MPNETRKKSAGFSTSRSHARANESYFHMQVRGCAGVRANIRFLPNFWKTSTRGSCRMLKRRQQRVSALLNKRYGTKTRTTFSKGSVGGAPPRARRGDFRRRYGARDRAGEGSTYARTSFDRRAHHRAREGRIARRASPRKILH